MNRTFAPLVALLSIVTLATAYGCGGDDDDDANNTAGTGGSGGGGQGGAPGGSGGAGGAPPSEQVGRLMVNDPDLNQLELVFGGAVDAQPLLSTSAVTLFAPRNDAFTSLGAGCADAIAQDATLSNNVARYHILPKSFVSSEVRPGNTVVEPTALAGQSLRITNTGGNLSSVNDTEAQVVQDDILGANGAIHKIDKVLIPPGVRLPAACTPGGAGAGGAGGSAGSAGAGGSAGAAGSAGAGGAGGGT